ncbi:MAG: hypothetical protein ACRC2R_16885 [Xenococcaceae cyanobacterium]
MLRITKLKGKGKFHLSWDEKPREYLLLDFSPLIYVFNLEGKYCLIHWQARPKGLRTWGIYDSVTNNYYPKTIGKILVPQVNLELLQIDENNYATVPTAVLYLKNCSIVDF